MATMPSRQIVKWQTIALMTQFRNLLNFIFTYDALADCLKRSTINLVYHYKAIFKGAV
jgi:hypothetical protein